MTMKHDDPVPFPLDLADVAARPERLPWRPFRPGVQIVRLHQTEGGSASALLRYEPGAGIPPHVHVGFEHILVLSGSQRDERGTYGVGRLVVNAPGTRHTVDSPEGCIVLAIWERPVAFETQVTQALQTGNSSSTRPR